MTLRQNISRWLNIREGERELVTLLMYYSFLMGGATALFYTLVASSFLTSFDRLVLPQVYIVGGVFVYALGLAVSQFQKRMPFDRLAENMLYFLTGTIALFLVVYHVTGSKWVFFVLFIWNRIFVLVNGVTFWAVVAKLFNFQQSKRLSGLINTGDVVSSVITYLAVPVLVRFVHTDILLIAVVVLLLLCSVVLRKIHNRFVRGVFQTDEEKKTASAGPVEQLDTTYYRNIFLMALLPVFALFYVEYLFFTESRTVFPDQTALAGFLGVFFGISAILEFAVKTFLYNRLIGRYGVKAGVLVLPVSLVFSFLLAVIYGFSYDTAAIFFACIALSRFFMSAVRKAISEPAYQLLYQPIISRLRLQVQARIEGRAKSMGGLIAGIVLLVLVNLIDLDALELSLIFLFVTLLWIVVSLLGQASYQRLVRMKVFHFRERKDAGQAVVSSFVLSNLQEGDLSKMVYSGDPKERRDAAIVLATSKRYGAYLMLIPLLQDADIHVRQAAVYAAGELRRSELWPYLVEQMEQDRYYTLATAALVKSGAPVLGFISKAFLSDNDNRSRQMHLLRVVEQIGGPEAVRFLRQNLENPNRFVKDKVVDALRRLEYTCNSTERSLLLNELDEHLKIFSWSLAAMHDLSDAYGAETQLMLNMEREKERIIRKAFAVLEVVYGSKFGVIRHMHGEHETDVRDYLTEICDLLLPENVRARIIPYLDSDSETDMRLRYAALFPQPVLDVEERLIDIVNKDYTRISRWTKAVAVKELRHYPVENVSPVLVANAVSRSKVISETAFYILRIVNPDRFYSLLNVMKRDNDQFHLSIMEPLEWLATEEDLLICKLRRMRETHVLSKLRNGELQKILLNSCYFKQDEGDVVDLRSYAVGKDVSLVVTVGKLLFSKAGIIGAGEVVRIEQIISTGNIMIPNVIEDAEFYITENYILRDLGLEERIAAQEQNSDDSVI